MKDPAAAEEEVLRDYLGYYAARAAQGELVVCHEASLKARARRLLGVGRPGALDVCSLAERCRRARGERGSSVLRDLLRALEVLELLCVNLLLCPWRKEIRSLKTFTGNFVYYIQSVLPDDIVTTVLEKIGYTATTATEFSLVRKRNNEETKQTAFEIFLARIECETILELTSEEKHGNVEKTLQKRTKVHQHHQHEDQTSQKEEAESGENKAVSDTELCLATQQQPAAHSHMSFDTASSLRNQAEVPQLAAAPSTTRPQEHQRQGTDSRRLSGKCSESEDFLSEYSDIFIRQAPLFGENLSPEAFENKPGASLSEECVLAATAEPAADEIRPVPLSPGASGPPAFAVFADGSCGSKTPLAYRAQQVPAESIEAAIHDAMNCIDSDPADEPSELKSMPYRDIASVQNCSLPREEEVCDLSLTFTKLQIKDTQEDLMYPVEETGLPDLVSYVPAGDSHATEVNHSRMPQTYPSSAQVQNRAAAHPEPSSDLCCAAGSMEDPDDDDVGKRLFVAAPAAHLAAEHFIHIREPPHLTYVPPRSIDVQSSHLRSAQGKRSPLQPEGDSSEASEVKLGTHHSKASELQEPYVIIDRTDTGMLCHQA
ncbi:uncharacterized protein LOC135184306 [Pogoniulus pusillus]|uniref:uncharacterized protein LOC135184306 n=1 Tax=Pogoniulus pusillus TaxID=488313 RepID=UPI0030B9656E